MEKHKNENHPVLKKTRSRFLSGLLVLVPITVTVLVIRFIVGFMASVGRPVLQIWIGNIPHYVTEILAFFMTFLLIYGAGFLATHITGRKLVNLGENILMKLPLVKSIYGASKNVVDAFAHDVSTNSEAVALVEFPRPGSWVIGFVMGNMKGPDEDNMYRVYVPTSPNPTSGFLLILPKKEIHFTDMQVETALKTILSGGSLGPTQYRFTQNPVPNTHENTNDAINHEIRATDAI